MRWYLTEAFRGVRSRPGFAIVLVIVTASLTGSALSYANTERARLRDEAAAVEVEGWYLVTFTDLTGEPMDRSELRTVCRLDAVAWAAGVFPAEDYTAPGTGRPVTLRSVRGCGLDRIGLPVDPARLHAPVGLISVFPFGDVPGTAAASLVGTQGTVTVLEHAGLPSKLLGGSDREGFLVLPDAGSPAAPDGISSIRIGVATLDEATELARSGPTILRDDDGGGVRVTPTTDQYDAQRTYLSGIDRRSGATVVGIVLIAAAVSAGMLLITVRLRAREYARRRTLGCRRLPLVAQVMVEAMSTTALGAVLGATAFAVVAGVDGDLVLPPILIVSVPAVMVAATGLLSVPIAVWVGAKDPILVLRVP